MSCTIAIVAKRCSTPDLLPPDEEEDDDDDIVESEEDERRGYDKDGNLDTILPPAPGLIIPPIPSF